MNPGFTIENKKFWVDDDCIIVSNYHSQNKIINYTWEFKMYCRQFKNDIGIWKLKKLKK